VRMLDSAPVCVYNIRSQSNMKSLFLKFHCIWRYIL